MNKKKVIFYSRTTDTHFEKWGYYRLDYEILKSIYSKVYTSNSIFKTIFLIIKYPQIEVYCYWWGSSFPVILIAKILKRKVMTTGAIHMFDHSEMPDFYSKNLLYKIFTMLALRMSDINLFDSKDQYLSITSHLKVNHPKLVYRVLTKELSLNKLNEGEIAKYLCRDKINLFFLSWLTKDNINRKSLKEIVEAIVICKSEFNLNIKLTIAGGHGDAIHKIKKLIRKYNLENDVDLEIDITSEEKYMIFQKSDLLVIPSKMEGFGYATLESMSFGCPSVVSRYGASPEVVGNTGYIVNMIEPRNIADVIVSYSKLSLNERIIKRKEAYQRAFKVFSFETKLKIMKDLINKF